MDNLTQQLDLIMNKKSDAENQILLDNQFPYIFTKAFRYLKIGPEKYRKQDFFKQPPIDLDSEELEVLTSGCKQILQGIGFSESEPFTNLDVSGFYNLMRLFHFQYTDRTTKHSFVLNNKKGILDCISFKHYVDDNRTCVLYNFCCYDFDTSEFEDSLLDNE